MLLVEWLRLWERLFVRVCDGEAPNERDCVVVTACVVDSLDEALAVADWVADTLHENVLAMPVRSRVMSACEEQLLHAC